MSTCKGCGAPIDWITTTEGKYIPVDPEPVFIIEGDGLDRFVTDEGAVLLGRRARPENGERHTAADNLEFLRGVLGGRVPVPEAAPGK